MKPTFALNITDDGFVLLHRTAKGWTSVGETLYSAPDLPEAMAYLRTTALGLQPKGMSTKIVIPNSQILYTEVEAPGPSDSARRKQIVAALKGRTPYEVSELVYDWSGKGPKLQVVAVAKETLREAEAFAVEHRLNPMSFVAIPEPGAFDGEPYFGMTAFAPGHLKSGETVERDPEPILPLSRSLPKAEVTPEKAPEPSPAAEAEAVMPKASEPEVAAARPEPAATPAVITKTGSASGPASETMAPVAAVPAPPALPMEPARLGASLTPKPSQAEIAPPTRSVPPVPAEIVPEAPFADVPEILSAIDIDDVPDMPGAPPRGGLPDDVPPAPASSIRVAFASRRSAGEIAAPPLSVPSSVPPATAAAVGRPSGGMIGTPPPLGAPDADPGRPRIVRDKPIEDLPPLQRPVFAAPKAPVAKPVRSSVAKSFGSVVAPQGLAGAKKKAKVVGTSATTASSGAMSGGVMPSSSSPPVGAARTLQPTKPLTKPGGTFGTPQKRGKPRYLGLMLTAILLVFLGLVAAWSSFYLSADTEARTNIDTAALDGGDTTIVAPDAVTPEAGDSASLVPAIEDEILADGEFVEEDAPLPAASATPAPDQAAAAEAEVSDPDADAIAASVAAAAATDIGADSVITSASSGAAAPDPTIGAGAAAPEDTALPQEAPPAEAAASAQDTASVAGTATPQETVPADSTATAETAAAPADTAAAEEPVLLAEPSEAASEAPQTLAVEEQAGDEQAGDEQAGEEPAAAEPALAPAPGTAIASDSPAAVTLTEDQDEIFLAGTDTPPPALDALSLPVPELSGDPPPGAQAPPPPFGTVYQFDERGLIRPTPEGIMTPEGVMLFAGAPPLLPPERPASVTDAAAAARATPAEQLPAAADADSSATPIDAAESPPTADPALGGFRPRPRPEGLTPPSADDAAAPVDAETQVTSLLPRAKPQTVISASESARQQSEAASLAAQAQAQIVAEAVAANDPSNPSLVAISRRPAARPQDFSRAVGAAVELAVAEAVREPEPVAAAAIALPEAAIALPEADEEPELVAAARSVPLKGTVAKKATFVNALNLSKINLIGVYGTDSQRYALVRQANGRFKKVRVGDRIDGGQVAAITASEMRYQKDGRLVSLKLPRG